MIEITTTLTLDLRTLLHYLHFIQVTSPFIIYSHLSFRHVESCSMAGHMSHIQEPSILVYLNGNNAAEGENNIKYANIYPIN